MKVLYNLKLSVRSLLKKPLFSGVIIFTIAITIAAALAFIVLQPINKFLYEVNLFYLPVYLISAIILLSVCILATLLPAWRATNVNPATALKNE